MGKLETPLTWALAILILGYFALNNCCKIESNNEINNGFSWSAPSEKVELVKSISEEDAINVDSIIEAVLLEVDSLVDGQAEFLDDFKAEDSE